MKFFGFRQRKKKTPFRGVFPLLGFIASSFLPIGPLMALESPHTTDRFRSLVKILAQRESVGVLHEGQLIVQPRVREISLFNGVVSDARGYIVSYVGNQWQQLELPGVEFWIERSDGKKFPARLIGVDERISLALVESGGAVDRSIAFGSSLRQSEYEFVSFKDEQWGGSPLQIYRLKEQKGVPELEARICKLTSADGKFAVEGSLILDKAGRFLGIVTETGDHQFSKKMDALQVLTVERIRASQVEILQSGGNVRAGWLGCFLDPEIPGASVTGILPGSPAEDAGLKSGDRIVALDGREVDSAQEFARTIRWKRPGSKVELEVEREGSVRKLSSVLSGRSGRPSQLAWTIQIPKVWNLGERVAGEVRLYQIPFPAPLNIGFVAEPLTPQLARYFKSPYDSGLLVKSVADGSPAGNVGFRAGDILLQINGHRMTAPEDLKTAVEQSEDGVLVIQFLRDAVVRTQKIVLQ